MGGAKPIMPVNPEFRRVSAFPHPVENVMRYGFSLVAAMLVFSTTSAMAGAAPPRTDMPTAPGASSAQMSQCNSPDSAPATGPNPKSVTAYANRGEAHGVQGESARAIQDYDFALKLDPKFATALINRGLAQEDKGDFPRAIADFTAAIKLDPKMVSAYDERARAYEQTGAHDRAVADVAEAIKLYPANPDLHKLQ